MVLVRDAESRDIGRLAVLHVAAWQKAFRGIITDEVLDTLSIAEFEAIWNQSLKMQARVNLAACVSGRVVGFIAVGPKRVDGPVSSEQAEVYGIYVDPVDWGKGAGRELMAQGMLRLRAQGFNYASLWVMSGNSAARGFYDSMGFLANGAKRTSERYGCRFEELEYSSPL